MGHWGTSILSNDTSADIKDIYFDMFDGGKSISSIREKLQRDFLEGDDISNNTNFWLTMSLLDWQIGDQDEKIKQLAIKIIDEQIDIKIWEESGADKSTLRKRDKVLLELKEKILNANPKPRKSKKKRIPKPIFKKGECFAFQMKNGNYTAVIVLEHVNSDDYIVNLIANTTINQSNFPTLKQIIESNILVLNGDKHRNEKYREAVSSYMHVKYKNVIKDFVKIGELEIKGNWTKTYGQFGFTPWQWIIDFANDYLVDNKSRPDIKIKTNKYLNNKHLQTHNKANDGKSTNSRLIARIKHFFGS